MSRQIEVKCPACGKTRLVIGTPGEYCRSCGAHICAWGADGFAAVRQIAAQPGPLEPSELYVLLQEFKGLVGRPSHNAFASLKRTLRRLGYRGEFIRRNHRPFGKWKMRNLPRDTKCAHCGATGNLETHHIVPLEWGGSITDPENLEVLCVKCHDAEHRRISREIRKRYDSICELRNLWMREHAEEFRTLISR